MIKNNRKKLNESDPSIYTKLGHKGQIFWTIVFIWALYSMGSMILQTHREKKAKEIANELLPKLLDLLEKNKAIYVSKIINTGKELYKIFNKQTKKENLQILTKNNDLVKFNKYSLYFDKYIAFMLQSKTRHIVGKHTKDKLEYPGFFHDYILKDSFKNFYKKYMSNDNDEGELVSEDEYQEVITGIVEADKKVKKLVEPIIIEIEKLINQKIGKSISENKLWIKYLHEYKISS